MDWVKAVYFMKEERNIIMNLFEESRYIIFAWQKIVDCVNAQVNEFHFSSHDT